MSGAHSTTYRYDEPAVRGGRVRSGYPDGMSPKVRVRYFDPATGEPRKTKLEPKRAKKRMEDQGKRAASLARARAKTIERCAQPVIVDGGGAPERQQRGEGGGMRRKHACEQVARWRGATEYRGHAIRFKDPRHARA